MASRINPASSAPPQQSYSSILIWTTVFYISQPKFLFQSSWSSWGLLNIPYSVSAANIKSAIHTHLSPFLSAFPNCTYILPFSGTIVSLSIYCIALPRKMLGTFGEGTQLIVSEWIGMLHHFWFPFVHWLMYK